MKRLLLILILTLSFQSWTRADDISDFEIEGMSIGDSLLDFFKEEDIQKHFYNNSKKFAETSHTSKNFEIYDLVSFHYKANDKNFIIYELNGTIYFPNKIQKCYDKKKEILAELRKLFPTAKKVSQGESKHPGDRSGESIYTYDAFVLNNGSVGIECTDWGNEMSSTGLVDGLILFIETEEFSNWLSTEAH